MSASSVWWISAVRLVRDTFAALLDATDFHAQLLLFDLCLRMYDAGMHDGATKVVNDAVELDRASPLTIGLTVPNGCPGSASECAQARSDQRYREILDMISDGVWRVDAGSRTDYVNPRMA